MDQLNLSRVHVRPIRASDASDICRVYTENAPLLPLLDQEHDPSILARRFMTRSNVPTGGSPTQLHNMLLCSPCHEPVGVLSVYLGYPQAHIAYIGELFLRPKAQSQGMGREICLGLEHHLRLEHFRALRVGVSLRNWRALRFWIRGGFLTITGISGEPLCTQTTYAYLELQKQL